jgi:dephospho-CoA kinase
METREVNDPRKLEEWIRQRSDLVVFVTGPTGCGKSTIVSNIAHATGAVGVHPGRAIRHNPRMMEILSRADNPSAPRETEEFVRSYVLDKMDTAKNRNVLVDGIPRNLSQVVWCVNVALDFKRDLVFVSVHVPYHVRFDRLITRNQEGDKELLHRRLKSDEKVLPEVVERAKQVVVGGKFGYWFEIENKCTNTQTGGGIDGTGQC